MGCAASASAKNSQASLQKGEASPSQAHSTGSISKKVKIRPELNGVLQPAENSQNGDIRRNKSANDLPSTQTTANGVAFEIKFGDDESVRKPLPKRLSKLEPINAPKLTAEDLAERQRLAERKRNSELEHRAKTASEARRQSKRKRELMVSIELERQQNQAKELDTKLKSAEKQRQLLQQQKIERQLIQEERIKLAKQKREKIMNGDLVDFDVEPDENFNNDDVDSWLEGSNNGNFTVDTGFSSATSNRTFSGQNSPKKRWNYSSMTRSTILHSASSIDNNDLDINKHGDQHELTQVEDQFFDT